MRIPIGTQLATRQPLTMPNFAAIPEPSVPLPQASGSVLAAVPQTFPGSSLTYDAFLYSQLQNSAQPGTANTWTAPQTFQITDVLTAGVTTVGTFSHVATGTTAAGLGAAFNWTGLNAAAASVVMGQQAMVFTNATAGAVDTALGLTVKKANTEIEVLRLQGGFGPAPAAGGGVSATGATGGRALIFGDLAVTPMDAVNNASLRVATFEHKLSAGSVAAGFGTEHYWQSRDASNNLIPLARQVVAVTTPTAGIVDSAVAWSISMGGVEAEVFRIQALGMTPQALGGITGFTGGRLLCQGDFRHVGTNFSVFGAAGGGQQTGGALTAGGTYTSNEQTMLGRLWTAMRAYGWLS